MVASPAHAMDDDLRCLQRYFLQHPGVRSYAIDYALRGLGRAKSPEAFAVIWNVAREETRSGNPAHPETMKAFRDLGPGSWVVERTITLPWERLAEGLDLSHQHQWASEVQVLPDGRILLQAFKQKAAVVTLPPPDMSEASLAVLEPPQIEATTSAVAVMPSGRILAAFFFSEGTREYRRPVIFQKFNEQTLQPIGEPIESELSRRVRKLVVTSPSRWLSLDTHGSAEMMSLTGSVEWSRKEGHPPSKVAQAVMGLEGRLYTLSSHHQLMLRSGTGWGRAQVEGIRDFAVLPDGRVVTVEDPGRLVIRTPDLALESERRPPEGYDYGTFYVVPGESGPLLIVTARSSQEGRQTFLVDLKGNVLRSLSQSRDDAGTTPDGEVFRHLEGTVALPNGQWILLGGQRNFRDQPIVRTHSLFNRHGQRLQYGIAQATGPGVVESESTPMADLFRVLPDGKLLSLRQDKPGEWTIWGWQPRGR